MNEAIKKKLQELLLSFPELKNTLIQFSETEATITDSRPASHDEEPVCKKKSEWPGIISGPSPKIEVRRSPVHGLGVFAKEKILAGELIEESKLLQLGHRRNMQHDAVLGDYVWGNRNCDCMECRTYGVKQYLALGFGSLYNHADKPNTRTRLDFQQELITFTANEDIEAGSEIFTHYGGKYWLLRDFWKNVQQNQEIEKQGFAQSDK